MFKTVLTMLLAVVSAGAGRQPGRHAGQGRRRPRHPPGRPVLHRCRLVPGRGKRTGPDQHWFRAFGPDYNLDVFVSEVRA